MIRKGIPSIRKFVEKIWYNVNSGKVKYDILPTHTFVICINIHNNIFF